MANSVQFLDADFKAGDPLRKVANAGNMNRIGNILNHIQGVGCRIIKNTASNGRGWFIVVDGASDVSQDSTTTIHVTDQYVRVHPTDVTGHLQDKIYRNDTTGYSDTADLICAWDTVENGSLGTQQRFHVPLAWITNPTHVIGRDSTGTIGWVATTDTCA